MKKVISIIFIAFVLFLTGCTKKVNSQDSKDILDYMSNATIVTTCTSSSKNISKTIEGLREISQGYYIRYNHNNDSKTYLIHQTIYAFDSSDHAKKYYESIKKNYTGDELEYNSISVSVAEYLKEENSPNETISNLESQGYSCKTEDMNKYD